MANDIMVATEVAARRPNSSLEWDVIAGILSNAFSKVEKPVDLSGRACREQLEQLIKKYKDEDKSLKRQLNLIFCFPYMYVHWVNGEIGKSLWSKCLHLDTVTGI